MSSKLWRSDLVGDLADAALPGGAGIGHENVDAAEALADCGEGGCTCSGLVTSHCRAKALDLGRCLLGQLAVDVEDRDGGAVGGKRLRGGGADGAGAGHQRHLAGQRLDHGAFQLGLFEAPIFEREEIALGQRLVAADGFGVGDDLDRVLGEIGGDGGVLRRAPKTEQADARHQHHARHGIELGLGVAGGFVLAGEIGVVIGDEFGDVLAHRIGEVASSLPASGGGTTSGVFLVRMMWSGVTTPRWL